MTDGMIERSVISYVNLCDRAGMPELTRICGPFLGEIAEWCEERGWPLLNALAVQQDSGIPGEGYSDILTWPEEVRECIAFDGYPDSVT